MRKAAWFRLLVGATVTVSALGLLPKGLAAQEAPKDVPITHWAFLMTGMELLTIKRLGLNPIILVLNNRGYTSLRTMGHQQATYLQQFPEVDFAQLATTLGGAGFIVETADQLRLALAKAKELPVFSLLDIRLRPDDVSPALQRLGDLFAQRLKG